MGAMDTTTPSTTDGTTADRSTFQDLLDRWAAAIVSNDETRIDPFMLPGWYLVTPESGPIARERFLSVVASGELTHSEMTFDVLDVQLYGDVAVVVARGENRGAFRGAPFRADEWVTEVFVRGDDGWRAAASALTPAQPAEERASGG